jgi:predicted DNA binding CopG/RHH family protein
MKPKQRRLRRLPQLTSDAAAARVVAEADLSRYDLAALKPVRFEFAPKDARVNMRLPQTLLDAVKRAAERTGVPYQRFIRHALERALQPDPASRMRQE